MTFFDVIVIGLACLAAVGGYRLGFVTRVLSWVGMAVGLVLAVRLLPLVLDRIDPSQQVAVVILTIGAAFLGATLGQTLGFLVGRRLRPPRAPGEATGTVDGIAGALAGLVGVLAIVWLILPVLTGLPGPVSQAVSRSWVAAELDERLPAPPDAMDALNALTGDDRFPQVFAGLAPTPDLGPPPAQSGLSRALAEQVSRSIVKVEGVACRRIQTGTGFVVGDGMVVTNAHVVAGEATTDLVRDDGTRVEATVVTFDPDHDLALLVSARLNRPALPIGESAAGQVGGVFGHPLGNPLRVAPFQVGRQIVATGRDIYDRGLTQREVLELAASLQHGDSGSPLVDPTGQVVGVTFAISPTRPELAYALSTGELRTLLDRPITGEVSTGACTTSAA